MGRKSIKENKNIYQTSREALGLTREAAADLLEFISADRIEKIESEKSLPHPEEVLAMAAGYKNPSLCNHYCSQVCPIGQEYVPEIKVKDLSQIKGKRVAVGAAGSGVEANARQIMEAYGISYDDIQVQYLSFSEAASALKDGNIDVAFLTAGYPTAAVQDISSQNKVRLLPVTADKADALIAKYPFYTKTVIPAGTYSGFDVDVPAVSVMAMLVANEKVTEQLGYDVAKSLFTNLDRLQAAHAVVKQIAKDKAMSGMPLKMNAGAEKFFKE